MATTRNTYWSWPTLVERGWTTPLYRQLLRGPDRTPRGVGFVAGAKGKWGILKSRVLAAEETPAFKDALKQAKKVRRRKRQGVDQRLAKAEGYEYVIALQRMPENPRQTLDAILGPDGWTRTARWPWIRRRDQSAHAVYLIRDKAKLAALRLTELNEALVWYRPIAKCAEAVRQRENV